MYDISIRYRLRSVSLSLLLGDFLQVDFLQTNPEGSCCGLRRHCESALDWESCDRSRGCCFVVVYSMLQHRFTLDVLPSLWLSRTPPRPRSGTSGREGPSTRAEDNFKICDLIFTLLQPSPCRYPQAVATTSASQPVSDRRPFDMRYSLLGVFRMIRG